MSAKAKWKNFSKEEIEEMVKNSYSFAQVAEKLGYSSKSGSGVSGVKSAISYYNIDCSHFLGQGWNKNNFDYSRFQKGKNIKIASAKLALIARKGSCCENCGLSTWLDIDIPLEVHHIDGDHLNNEIDNLQLLCPNCHALTENWRGKNIDRTKKIDKTDEEFVEALKSSSNVRQALLKLGLTAAGGNYARAYDLVNKYNITFT